VCHRTLERAPPARAGQCRGETGVMPVGMNSTPGVPEHRLALPPLWRWVPVPGPDIVTRGVGTGRRVVVACRLHLPTDDPTGLGDGGHVDGDVAGAHRDCQSGEGCPARRVGHARVRQGGVGDPRAIDVVAGCVVAGEESYRPRRLTAHPRGHRSAISAYLSAGHPSDPCVA
jgi:hypothetical protein